jgi:predicted transcriptional regulator
MAKMIRIYSIRDRATKINLTLKKLCDEARIPYSTVYRWLNHGADPRMGSYERICERLEGALTHRENALLTTLITSRRAS